MVMLEWIGVVYLILGISLLTFLLSELPHKADYTRRYILVAGIGVNSCLALQYALATLTALILNQ